MLIRISFVSFLFYFLVCPGFSQTEEVDPFLVDEILENGIAMYELERTTIYAAQAMRDKGLSREGIYGHLSYRQGDTIKTIYFGPKKAGNTIRYTFEFPRPVELYNRRIDGSPRPPTERELKLINIHYQVNKQVKKNRKFFRQNDSLGLNLVMLEDVDRILAYLLPNAPAEEIMPLGHDYELIFTPKGKLKSRRACHNNFIPIPTKSSSPKGNAAMHRHEGDTCPYITASDICLLLLYRDFCTWQVHLVVSENYVSWFSMDDQKLQILPKEKFEELMEGR